MSDGKRPFIAESLLCYSYKLILISPGIFHRALFEKWLTLVAEKSPESAKFTYSNLEAFNVHPPSYVILILKKCHFSLYSYNRCLIKDPTERLKIYAYFENSQTCPRGPFDSPEGWVHHKISLAIFGLVLGAIWNQTNWPGQQGGPGNGKINQKNASETLPKLTLGACFTPPQGPQRELWKITSHKILEVNV